MAIPDHVRANFNTLLRAARRGDLALMECTDAKTGEVRHVLCSVEDSHGEFQMTPFGHMCPEPNPFEAYNPPEPA